MSVVNNSQNLNKDKQTIALSSYSFMNTNTGFMFVFFCPYTFMIFFELKKDGIIQF